MTQIHIIQWLKKRWKQDKSLILATASSALVTILAINASGLLGAHFFQRYVPPTKQVTTTILSTSNTKSQSSSSVSSKSIRPKMSLKTKRLVLESPAPLHAAAGEASSVGISSSSVSSVTNRQSTLGRTVHPVSRVPNWGAMRTPAEWNRSFSEMNASDFVAVPPYHLSSLTIPLTTLTKPSITEASIPLITAKLYYSTRYMGTYDLDADEGSGTHDGVDLKLAPGTPVGTIGGGRVIAIKEDGILGTHVLVEHQLLSGERYLSIYGHLSIALVTEGQTVAPGQVIGTVGMTGNTSGPHLHLGLHKKIGEGSWDEYSGSESVNPMTFVLKYAGGE